MTDPPIFVEARKLFLEHDVFKGKDKVLQTAEGEEVETKWKDCDEKGLKDFLCDKFGFNDARVQNGIDKLKKSKGMASQKRMDSFFTKVAAPTATNKKRKVPEKKGAKGKGAKKQKKGNSGFARR